MDRRYIGVVSLLLLLSAHVTQCVPLAALFENSPLPTLGSLTQNGANGASLFFQQMRSYMAQMRAELLRHLREFFPFSALGHHGSGRNLVEDFSDAAAAAAAAAAATAEASSRIMKSVA